MDIATFPLSWRWTQASHAKLADEVLSTLRPLPPERAALLCAAAPKRLGPGALRHHATEDVQMTREWLASLPQPAGRVVAVWGKDTAVSLPWPVLVTYWNDFCYPSSDDVDVFTESGALLLRWHHDQVFEYGREALK